MSNDFSVEQSQDIVNYYQANGYVVIKNVICEQKIAAFMREYEKFKAAKSYYYRSQDTNLPEQVAVNDEGFIEHSILSPTNLVFQKQFRTSIQNIIYAPEISQLLTTITNKQKHTVWQTMFFDKSTGTVAHQDHYYLDSDPCGHLVACWFALEDIHEDSGTFFVVPGSHKGPVISGNSGFRDHKEYVVKMQQLFKEQGYQPQPMPLEKGSVLLWHPFLVHGAFQNVNPSYSRKSFTAHYLPDGYGQLNTKQVPARQSSFNPDILVWKLSMLEQIQEHLRYVRYGMQVKFRSREVHSEMEMRGTKY